MCVCVCVCILHTNHPRPCSRTNTHTHTNTYASRSPHPRPACLQETLKELPPLLARGFWGRLKAVRENRVVLVDGNQMFNRPGPRLVDAFEFLVGLLHGRHDDVIPPGFPWRFLRPDELSSEVAAWLEAHPGWATAAQKGPPPPASAAQSGKVSCCGPDICSTVVTPAAAPTYACTDACGASTSSDTVAATSCA